MTDFLTLLRACFNGVGRSKPPHTRFSHPTRTGHVRGQDAWGNGSFGATRDGGKRLHKGTDYIAIKDQPIHAVITGTITKIGYPYADDLSFRYIEISAAPYRIRHFYVAPDPTITVGASVDTGAIIGRYQSLDGRYPSITEHVHIEVRKDGDLIDPETVIPSPI